MCFDHDSAPPIPVVSGGSVDQEDLVLTASDGNEFAAFAARADGARLGVVILPDVRGLYRFYEELALRFAEHGYDAVAIDYFGRSAGIAKRPNDWDFWPHVEQTTLAGIKADTAAAIGYLRGDSRRAPRPDLPVIVVGFCFGGSNAWHQAANELGIAGAIGFYGHPDRAGFPTEAPPVIERVVDVSCPILALMGGADPGIPTDESDRFRLALTEAGIDNEIIVYPGAPHSFFDRKQDDFLSESADAWSRVLAFAEAASR